MEDFRDEIDVVVSSMQLLAELLPVMIEDLWKRKMIHTIMDTIQYYAPPPCQNRPRVVQRLIPTNEEREEMFMADEDTLSKAVNAEWQAEYAALAAEIAEEMAAGGPKKKRKKKYKEDKEESKDLSRTIGSTSVVPRVNSTSPATALGGGGVVTGGYAVGESSIMSPPRSSVKSAKSNRGDIGNVSFHIDAAGGRRTKESASSPNPSAKTDGTMPPIKPLSKQGSHIASRSFARSRSNIGAATATLSIPQISFSKNSFQSGVFQSSEFNLSNNATPTQKSWKGEFISRRCSVVVLLNIIYE